MYFKRRSTRGRLALTATITLLVTLSAARTADASSHRSNPSGSSSQSTTCPDGWYEWETEVGVAQCGDDDGFNLIMINLTEGAKLRVVSEWDSNSPEAPSEHAKFFKKTAFEWAEHISGNGGPAIPSPSMLTHVVNAGFLVSDAGDSTTLSLPEKRSGGIETYGFAMAPPQQDPAFSFPNKKSLLLGYPGDSVQSVEVGTFTSSSHPGYDADRVNAAFSGAYDATVGYWAYSSPSEGDDQKPRTFFFQQSADPESGRDEMAFILTADGATLFEMNLKISELSQEMTPTLWTSGLIQLDGGSSSQWYSLSRDYWWHGGLPRPVPEVLAIYHG